MFFKFSNSADGTAELYIYGDIVSGEKWDRSEVNTDDFKETLFGENGINPGQSLNMYINSGGGSCFAASAMCSMLERVKQQGSIINAYIDGLAASAASWLPMKADNIYLYKNSIIMIHKPMSIAYGNAEDFKKTIETLDLIENNTMIPLYMNKAKCDESKIRELIEAESWLSADEAAEIFDAALLDEEKQAAACVSDFFKRYKHTPENILTGEKKYKADYGKYEELIANLRNGL